MLNAMLPCPGAAPTRSRPFLLLALALLLAVAGFAADVPLPVRSLAAITPISYPVTLEGARQALAARRFETSRRICLRVLADNDAVTRNDLLRVLHDAECALGDFPQALRALQQIQPTTDTERVTIALLIGEDYHRFSAYDYYRASDEANQGFSGDEYAAQMEAKADEYFHDASVLATTDDLQRLVTEALRRNRRLPRAPAPPPPPAPATPPSGSVSGTMRFPDGAPVADATVTLGLHLERNVISPADYLDTDLGYYPPLGKVLSLTTTTDALGHFRFAQVPEGQHEFLAITLDPAQYAIPTRFVAQGINVVAGQDTAGNYTVTEWHSAPAPQVANPFPVTITRAGMRYTRRLIQPLSNPFAYDFPTQLLELDLPHNASSHADRLLLLCSTDQQAPRPFQLRGRRIAFFAELPAMSDRVYALYEARNGHAEPFTTHATLQPVPESGGKTAIIDTGRAQFRIPYGSSATPLPPLLAVRGEDGIWRGQGRFRLPAGVSLISQRVTVLEDGPLITCVRIAYRLSHAGAYSVTLTAHQGEAYLLAREKSSALDGAAFEFSLREFSGGRGFLHWTPEAGGTHWQTLTAQDAEVARLQESVPWWIPPQGFGYAMTADGLQQRDYIGVFTVRRGEWIDRKFATITQGPGENHELDWPYPEMVGSTISMITANTAVDGDAYFRFKFFDGERQWGILVSTLDRNDGPFKEISAVQHKNSSPRLQEFKDWHLDEPDHILRPFVVARRDDLCALRKKKESPVFARYWQLITTSRLPGPITGLRFAVDNDPAVAWRKKLELVQVAQIYPRMHLLGRDFSDIYSPVGGRPLTDWAQDYDLIAASGVFTPEEERLVRRFLMLAAHMYMSPDLMNWHYNGRNANFEADRSQIIGTIGVTFTGNQDAKLFVSHATSRLERILNVYCTPGSGRWYENPACYYLQSMKCWASLAYLLSSHGLLDPTSIPRLKEFMSWGVNLTTPPVTMDSNLWLNGATDEAYAAAPRIRVIPPIGDHAGLGGLFPEQYALLAKLYRKRDPAFADRLLWAYQAGGMNGGGFGDIPQLFATLTEDDLRPAAPPALVSRRLEGFGAVLRGHVGEANEFYLLFKQGPGGYRYQRTEGSIILFANGKPLIYDGGEMGETWRHSTLSFYDTHMPLAPGHVERFASFPSLDFVQGVHPVALKPGQPIQLNDDCRDTLVPLAYQRYAEPHPADARSVWWVKDDYVILHDELQLEPHTPSYWHLQVVADAQHGDAQQGFIFTGRFGTDMQVLLPDQHFTRVTVEPVSMEQNPRRAQVSMEHLQATGDNPDHYLAVLRPLAVGAAPVAAQALTIGARTVGVAITGAGIDDTLWFARDGMTYTDARCRFTGRYAAVLRRTDGVELLLLDGRRLDYNGVTVESDGPAVRLRISTDRMTLTADGAGRITVTDHGKRKTLSLHGKRVLMEWPR